jgi:hypothetical protein
VLGVWDFRFAALDPPYIGGDSLESGCRPEAESTKEETVLGTRHLPIRISVTVRASVPRIVPGVIIRVIRPDILSLLGPKMNLHGLYDRIDIDEIS